MSTYLVVREFDNGFKLSNVSSSSAAILKWDYFHCAMGIMSTAIDTCLQKNLPLAATANGPFVTLPTFQPSLRRWRRIRVIIDVDNFAFLRECGLQLVVPHIVR